MGRGRESFEETNAWKLIRATTREGLAALKPVQPGCIHTPGNSSQVSDGAAALLYMSAEKARAHGLRPRARIVHDVVVGADPATILEGPIDATRKILAKSGRSLRDIDVFECNEAFAAQAENKIKKNRTEARKDHRQRLFIWNDIYSPGMSACSHTVQELCQF